MQTLMSLWLPIWEWFPYWFQVLLLSVGGVVLILVPLLVAVAWMPYAERKVLAYMHVRIGPNRVGPKGWLQPLADALKLLLKEIVLPARSNKALFITAPILAMAPAMAAWAVVPFNDGWVLADIDAGLLYILALSSMGVYGIILAGWASNSKYAFLGGMRSAAQIVAYEIAMGFALVGVLMAANSLNLGDIVKGQAGGLHHWYFLPLFPLFLVYFISGVAETNRSPFDVAEGESELVAGFHVEFSAMGFGLFFLAEYANMILIAALTSTLFLGGWLSPLSPTLVPSVPVVGALLGDGMHWLLAKMSFLLFVFLWLRATFPRYRYDQIMRLGWKVLIPVTLVWIGVMGAAMFLTPWGHLFH